MRDFTEGNIGKQILYFALPIIGANLLMQSYQFVDCLIVGRFIGKEALAAVGASAPVLFAIISIMIGLGSGAAVVISQYFGAKQKKEVQLTSETIQIVFIVIGILIGIIGISAAKTILVWMGVPTEIIEDATNYLSIYLGGIIFSFGFYTLSSMLRGVGDSITPLFFYLGSALLNIVLDIIFIVILDYKITSAAVATILSQGIMYLMGIIYINNHDKGFKIHFKNITCDRKILKNCLHYGIPTAVQQFLVALGSIALMSIVSSFGTDVVAGYVAGVRIDSIAILPAMNFAAAITPFVGQNISVGNFTRIKHAVRYTLAYSISIALINTIILQLLAPEIVSLFSKDAQVIYNGAYYLRIISAFYILFNIMFVLSGLMKGSGAMIFTTIITILSLWLIRIPLAKIFALYFGADGIWWSIPTGWGVGCICMVLYYCSGKWKNKSVVNPNTLEQLSEIESQPENN